MTSRIIYIMGVAGSGKTTIGKKLAEKLSMPFFDADDLHPASNIEKMKSGQPLNDEDRAAWLESVNALAKDECLRHGAIIACSALKEKYRTALAKDVSIPVLWVFLRGDYDLLLKRLQERKDHFMGAGMLSSQFAALEAPVDALVADVLHSPEMIVDKLMSRIKR
jgi:carbohydrate kinase (thermoresistant glucokinase family)